MQAVEPALLEGVPGQPLRVGADQGVDLVNDALERGAEDDRAAAEVERRQRVALVDDAAGRQQLEPVDAAEQGERQPVGAEPDRAGAFQLQPVVAGREEQARRQPRELVGNPGSAAALGRSREDRRPRVDDRIGRHHERFAAGFRTLDQVVDGQGRDESEQDEEHEHLVFSWRGIGAAEGEGARVVPTRSEI